MISQVLLFRKIMHCKFFGVFAYCFLFLFVFLKRCEFRFIESIGTHSKQNPDFIIIIKYKSIEFFVFDYDSLPNLLSVGGYFSFSCS